MSTGKKNKKETKNKVINKNKYKIDWKITKTTEKFQTAKIRIEFGIKSVKGSRYDGKISVWKTQSSPSKVSETNNLKYNNSVRAKPVDPSTIFCKSRSREKMQSKSPRMHVHFRPIESIKTSIRIPAKN